MLKTVDFAKTVEFELVDGRLVELVDGRLR